MMKLILAFCSMLMVLCIACIPSYAQQQAKSDSSHADVFSAAKIDVWVTEAQTRCMQKLNMAAEEHQTALGAYSVNNTAATLLAGQREATLTQEYWMCQIHAELAGLRQLLMLQELQKQK